MEYCILWSNMFQKSLSKEGIFPTDKRLQADDIMETGRLVSSRKEEALRRWRRRVGEMREEGNRDFEFILFYFLN